VSIEKEFSITGGIAKNKGMVAKLRDKVGLEPLLCDDPQIVGALGAALFAVERLKGVETEEAKIQYGYSDGTGEYFITIDNALCDGCGECVTACPEGVLEIFYEDSSRPKARVREDIRKRLAYACPGFSICGKNETNCHTACRQKAISHTW
jgi:ferredoxin